MTEPKIGKAPPLYHEILEKKLYNALQALDHAKAVIRNYQLDIANSSWTGIDLVEKGFCQGYVYKMALSDIEALLEERI